MDTKKMKNININHIKILNATLRQIIFGVRRFFQFSAKKNQKFTVHFHIILSIRTPLFYLNHFYLFLNKKYIYKNLFINLLYK